MEVEELLNSKANKENCDKVNVLFNEAEEDSSYYKYFDNCLILLDSKEAYVRVRAFIMLVKLSRHDKDNKVEKNIDTILRVLNDNKPAYVRVAITYLEELVKNKPSVLKNVKSKIDDIDYSIYKDTMIPLLKSDFNRFIDCHNK